MSFGKKTFCKLPATVVLLFFCFSRSFLHIKLGMPASGSLYILYSKHSWGDFWISLSSASPVCMYSREGRESQPSWSPVWPVVGVASELLRKSLLVIFLGAGEPFSSDCISFQLSSLLWTHQHIHRFFLRNRPGSIHTPCFCFNRT